MRNLLEGQSLGTWINRQQRETLPGIKGTPSESLGEWLAQRQGVVKPPDWAWYYGFSPYHSIKYLWQMLAYKKKPAQQPVTEWEKSGLAPRGYTSQDIDTAQIKADMGVILKSQGKTITKQQMVEELRKRGYTDEAIRIAGVRI